jgi:predicted transcriptional regulator
VRLEVTGGSAWSCCAGRAGCSAVGGGGAAGQTIEQIARSSGRSKETIRSQLRAVMSKTGCTRQVELVLLMRQLAGAVR